MSQPIRWVLSVDEETVQIVDRWQQKLSPFADGNRSLLVRLLIKLWDKAATDATLAPMLVGLQGLKVIKSEYELPAPSLSVEGRAKPPVRTGQVGGSHRGRVSGVSRRVALATEAYGITFFPLHLRLDSTRGVA